MAFTIQQLDALTPGQRTIFYEYLAKGVTQEQALLNARSAAVSSMDPTTGLTNTAVVLTLTDPKKVSKFIVKIKNNGNEKRKFLLLDGMNEWDNGIDYIVAHDGSKGERTHSWLKQFALYQSIIINSIQIRSNTGTFYGAENELELRLTQLDGVLKTGRVEVKFKDFYSSNAPVYSYTEEKIVTNGLHSIIGNIAPGEELTLELSVTVSETSFVGS